MEFAFVRHPLSRFYSAYKYIVNGGNHSLEDVALATYVQSKFRNEVAFLDAADTSLFYQIPFFKPQWCYVCDAVGEIRLDRFAKVENIETKFARICNRLGVANISLDKINQSQKSAKLVDHVRLHEVYGKDYELFGYR